MDHCPLFHRHNSQESQVCLPQPATKQVSGRHRRQDSPPVDCEGRERGNVACLACDPFRHFWKPRIVVNFVSVCFVRRPAVPTHSHVQDYRPFAVPEHKIRFDVGAVAQPDPWLENRVPAFQGQEPSQFFQQQIVSVDTRPMSPRAYLEDVAQELFDRWAAAITSPAQACAPTATRTAIEGSRPQTDGSAISVPRHQ